MTWDTGGATARRGRVFQYQTQSSSWNFETSAAGRPA